MRKKHSGAVLIITLIILFTLTILVLSGNKTVLLQEKMTMAVRNTHITLEMTESGTLDAESFIETLTSTTAFNASGTGGLYSQDNGPSDIFASSVWSDSKTANATTSVSQSGKVAQYFIEYLGLLPSSDSDSADINMTGYGETSNDGDVHGFKIVSRSQGDNDDNERIVVSYYGKSF
ncbi:PilX N-terminal domain-containing pilus assembly protein [Psychromonas sp. KJ10-10]|uniref:pilus assembly PilX family protein n=1 Tax=Psychromonas sp. KJ10-10 TaxID=3391823 RepID=UPI0039B6BF01